MRVYEIAARVSLTGNATEALGALAAASLNVERHFKSMLQHIRDFDRQGRLIIGGFAVFTADKLGHAIGNIAKHAEKLSRQLADLKGLGASAADYARMRQAAMSLPSAVPGITSAQALQIESATYAMLYNKQGGVGNVTGALPALAKFQINQAHILGQDMEAAQKSTQEMVRAGELMGRLVDEKTRLLDPGKLNKWLDIGTRLTAATHGMVNPHTLLMLAQQGSPAMSGMTEQGFMEMGVVAQAMGGPRAGTALQSLFQQMRGGKMWQQAAEELNKLGLVGDFRKERGGHLVFEEGALDTPFAKALEKDPLKAADIFQKTLEEHGFGPEDKITEIFKMFQRQTSQRLMFDLMRNSPQMRQEVESMAKAFGNEDFFKLIQNESVTQAMSNISAAWEDMLDKMSLPAAQALIPLFNTMGDFFEQIGAFATAYPSVFAELAKGLAALTAVFAVAGTALLISALGFGGWLIVSLTAFAGLMLWRMAPDMETTIKNLKDFGRSFRDFSDDLAKKVKEKGWQAVLLELNDKLGAMYERQNKKVIELISTYVTWDNVLKLNDLVWLGAITVFEEEVRRFGAVIEWIDSKWNQMMDSIKGAFSRLWDYIKSLLPAWMVPSGFSGGGMYGGGIIPASYGGYPSSFYGGMAGGGYGGGGYSGGGGGTPIGGGGSYGAVPGGGMHVKAAIDAAAKKYGIDPRVMYGIVAGESFHTGKWDVGDSGTSFGPFQMRTVKGAFGWMFQRDTGKDPRDPSNFGAMADYAAKYIAHGGSMSIWRGFHGPRDWNPSWGSMGVPGGAFGGAKIPLSGAAARAGAGYALGHMHPEFQKRLGALMAAAAASGHPLSVFSGWRSQEHQNRLFARSDRSGHMVARHSMHTRGLAADLRGDLAWAHQHAREHGLTFPMPWENWHIEPEGGRTGKIGTFPRGNAHLRRPHQRHHTITETNIHLDGRVIARHVTRHQVAAATHAHQAPHFDGSRLYSGPDRQTNTS